ncbi:MAG: helix-turn-helix transcriptional regulator [bacterium]|nr:helix-turn-helix transcriptional regulator [bacterium]
MNIGEKLRKMRKMNDLSQAELSKRISVHATNIARYESNKQKPTIDVLKKIADYYDVTIDYFLSENDDIKPASKIRDKVLLEKFEKIEDFDEDEKRIIIELIDAFIAKHEMKKLIKG